MDRRTLRIGAMALLLYGLPLAVGAKCNLKRLTEIPVTDAAAIDRSPTPRSMARRRTSCSRAAHSLP